eukprot:1080554-Pelagomonas_calceolata.AAC.1
MKQIPKAPQRSASDITIKTPCQSHPNLQLKIADWKSLAYTDGSCQVQNGKTVIGAGRAELTAIAAALTHDYTHTATDSLRSLHQLINQILYPEKHRHHEQGYVLKIISNFA